MSNWNPISLNDLFELIKTAEADLKGDLLHFWQLIKTRPSKWNEIGFGDEGGGFWVVAICGNRVIWYNDIEEGFNISNYKIFGEIDGYYCNQDKLNWAVIRFFDLVKLGGDIMGQSAPPQEV